MSIVSPTSSLSPRRLSGGGEVYGGKDLCRKVGFEPIMNKRRR